jgi:hypothetical protein
MRKFKKKSLPRKKKEPSIPKSEEIKTESKPQPKEEPIKITPYLPLGFAGSPLNSTTERMKLLNKFKSRK